MKRVTSPQEFLGFRVGDDRKLAGWADMVGYFERLETESDRLVVTEIGRSTEDHPFNLCVISSADNIERLDEYKAIQQSLSDPEPLGSREAEDSIRRARAVVAVTCSIHATEVGGSQMSLELAHLLASSDEERVRSILENVILLLVPTMNPDGLIRVKDWYDASLGTHFEGSIPPYLYHKYTGHDNNRDWFMFTQKETRLVVEHIHNAWHPHITYDIHQTRADGMRMILPPLLDPIGPNVDPVIQSEMAALGAHMAAQLVSEGKAGVAMNMVYDSYSPSRSYPHYHGGLRILSEAASAKIATPIDIPASALREDRGETPKTKSWKHPLPWKGGVWKLRDIVDYNLSAAMACLDHAAHNRGWWVGNSYDVLKRASASQSNPYAYVIPKAQHDPSAADELLELMEFAEVRIHRAEESFNHEGFEVEAGDNLIFTQQPFGSFAQTMLETQSYPDIREYPAGPPKQPYDATSHSLPLSMGVECYELKTPISARTSPLGKPASVNRRQARPVIAEAPAYALEATSNASVSIVNRLLFSGHPVLRAYSPTHSGSEELASGTWLLPASDASREVLSSTNLRVGVRPVETRPETGIRLLRPPRIGVYASYVPSIEEGWTRYVFDSYGFEYTSLVDSDIKELALESRFDCIIIPHQRVRQLRRGFSSAHYAPRFSGGLGDRGIAALRRFAERGGTIIGWDDSSRLLSHHLKLPVSNPLARLQSPDFFAPGSLLRIDVDNTHPIGFGMPANAAALYMNGPAYRVEKGDTIARFSEEETLLSGLLIGQEHIAGLSALVSVPVGLGKVILFGFRPHFRAQARGAYKLLFNSVYDSVK